MSSQFDVVIIGAGPVGLMLSVCLAQLGHRIKIVDNRDEATVAGRADGIQPRSLHILNNIGLKRQIKNCEPGKIYEIAAWDPQKDGSGIHRTEILPCFPKFIDSRYVHGTLLQQGTIERIFTDELSRLGVEIQRPWTIADFHLEGEHESHPIRVRLRHVEKDQPEEIQTKYLFSAEGARSSIREKLGVAVHYKDPIMSVWAVLDGIVRTNFPDIRFKSTIRSDHGSILVIPREHDLVRLYVQLPSADEFDSHRQVTAEEVQSVVKKILQPYYIDWDHIAWCSAYPVRQGIAEKYSVKNRIFMGGDCCHTHSPKAGQGMNTAFHDALNLSWKLHLVEAGFADRSILSTYESERKAIAEDLLNFDAKYAALFSQRSRSRLETNPLTNGNSRPPSVSETKSQEDEFVNTLKANQDFLSGYGVVYGPNTFNLSPSPQSSHSPLFLSRDSSKSKNIATNIPRLGRAMPTTDATRVMDGHPVALDLAIPFNGAFRLYIFTGHPPSPSPSPTTAYPALTSLCTYLSSPNTFYSTTLHPSLSAPLNPHTPSSISPFSSSSSKHTPHTPFISISTIIPLSRKDINIDITSPTCILPAFLAQDYRCHIYADDRGPSSSRFNLSSGAAAAAGLEDGIGGAHAKMGFDIDVTTNPDTADTATDAHANTKQTVNGHAGDSSSSSSSSGGGGISSSNATHNGTSTPPSTAPKPTSSSGGVVVVRPDGHVGCVVRLVEGPGTGEALEEYFAGFMAKAGREKKMGVNGVGS